MLLKIWNLEIANGLAFDEYPYFKVFPAILVKGKVIKDISAQFGIFLPETAYRYIVVVIDNFPVRAYEPHSGRILKLF
jgi:hypothetical protein